MSETGAPYRTHTSSAVALAFRYVPFLWYKPLFLTPLAAMFAWGTVEASPGDALRIAGSAFAFFGMISLVIFPVVSIRARIEGGQLVVRGCRWPGPERVWTCSPGEARDFEVDDHVDQRARPYWRLALRTNDGQVLPLTTTAWPGGTWLKAKLVRRLNTWLAEARGEA